MLSLQTLGIIVLVAAVAYLAVRLFLRTDKAVDLWQEDVAEFATFLASRKLTRLAAVFRSISAINITGTLRKIRALREEIMQAEDKEAKWLELVWAAVVEALRAALADKYPNYVREVVKLVLDSPAARTEIQRQMQERPAGK